MTKGISKRDVWLKHYLNDENPETFLNATRSAKAAGYTAKNYGALGRRGSENKEKHKKKINRWIDEVGLSEETLKLKLKTLLEARETVFFQKDGIVTDQRTVVANETQRRTLDMALKVKGSYQADKLNSADVDRVADRIVSARKRAESKG